MAQGTSLFKEIQVENTHSFQEHDTFTKRSHIRPQSIPSMAMNYTDNMFENSQFLDNRSNNEN